MMRKSKKIQPAIWQSLNCAQFRQGEKVWVSQESDTRVWVSSNEDGSQGVYAHPRDVHILTVEQAERRENFVRINSIRTVIRVRVSDCTITAAETWARNQGLRVIQVDAYGENSFVIQAETKGFDFPAFQEKHHVCLVESCGDVHCKVHNRHNIEDKPRTSEGEDHPEENGA